MFWDASIFPELLSVRHYWNFHVITKVATYVTREVVKGQLFRIESGVSEYRMFFNVSE